MSVEDHRLIHSCFCKLTGNYDLILTMGRHMAWSAWKAHGWTESDLELVIRHVKQQIHRGRLWDSALRFSRLICQSDFFSEQLSEARALARVPKVDKGKASVLRATGREPFPDSENGMEKYGKPAQSAESIIRGNEELKKLLDLRDSL